jgi:hypothetical protein
MTGHARVKRHDPQAVDQKYPVQGIPRSGIAKKVLPHRRAVVVITHDPHDLAPKPCRERLDQSPQLPVGARLACIHEVAGENQRRRGDPRSLDTPEQPLQSGIGVNRSVQRVFSGKQVSIREMEQNVIRSRIFRDPQCRHRTATSPGSCAVRHYRNKHAA